MTITPKTKIRGSHRSLPTLLAILLSLSAVAWTSDQTSPVPGVSPTQAIDLPITLIGYATVSLSANPSSACRVTQPVGVTNVETFPPCSEEAKGAAAAATELLCGEEGGWAAVYCDDDGDIETVKITCGRHPDDIVTVDPS